jgi:6-phosphogluconolactonase (cycloisomerase 2 family)
MKNAYRRAALLAVWPLGLSVVGGCGSDVSSTGSAPAPVASVMTPTVTVAASPSGSITTAQALSVTVGVIASNGSPAGSVVLSSGSYASFPATVSNGQATITVPAGLLALGTDALTASFTPASTTAYNSASGSMNVTVVASGAALPVVSATTATYSTAGYGSPFRALPLPSGEVLVSVTATTSGMVAFTPATGGGLQFSCFNYVRSAFVQDGASDFGMNLTPNGLNMAASLGVDGAIFYNLSTLETCTSTGVQVSQGAVSADEGSFDVVVSPDGKYAFVANEYGVAAGASTEGNIGVVALQYDSTGIVTTGTLVGQISTGGQAIAGVTISPDGSRLYVTSEVAGTGTAAGAGNTILTKTNCVQQAGSTPQANGLLTVINVAAAEANPSSAAIISTVNAGCSPVRAVETPDNSTLWVSARGDNRVLAFSTGMLETNPGNALLGYADTGGTAPVGLRLFDGGKLLAVANSNRFNTGTANATVLSVAVPASASVVQTFPTGLFPREITVGSDDRTLYLTNYSSGTFQVMLTTVH